MVEDVEDIESSELFRILHCPMREQQVLQRESVCMSRGSLIQGPHLVRGDDRKQVSLDISQLSCREHVV